MEMEVVISSPAVDFNFDTASTSPCVISSPSSPNRFGNCFFSAPTRTTSLRHFNTSPGDSLSTISFGWELKPRTPKREDNSSSHDGDDDDDGYYEFEFDFSGQLERTTLTAADELFDGGKLKPSKPPPPPNGVNDSPKPPINTKDGRETPSPRNMKSDFDQFAAKIEESHNSQEKLDKDKEKRERGRGRERPYNSSVSSRKQRGTRSQSPPLRVCEIFCESHRKFSDSSPPSKAKESSSKKWRLKDMWVFGSASEGSNKEELKKYSLLKKSGTGEDAKESSFRSTESGGGGASVRRRGVAVSAHERHYAAKKAAADEMRRKTLLPYKYGLMGCFGFNFNPAVHDISKGLGSLTRG